jgi:pimeloyl-ACP methyl ester carboxylesterase
MKPTQRLAIGYIQAKFKLLRFFSRKKTAEQAYALFTTPYARSKQKEPPANAELLHFKLNERDIRGYRWNHPQDVKVLILHGFGSSAMNFAKYVGPLVGKGYEVLAFDAPAHGASEGMTTNAVEYSEMIQKVMEQYGPVNRFIAHSFGGIALSLAMEDIPHDEQTRMAFIAPATETTTAVDIAFSMLKIKDERVRKEFDGIIYKLSGREVSWFSIRRAMENIRARVLWIHDEDDEVTPLRDALKVKEDNRDNISFVITKGLGHRKIYRDEEIKKQVIAFL